MLSVHRTINYKGQGMNANQKQIGGQHYKQFQGFEPWDVINVWGLGYLDGNAIKYIARWKHKNGVQDLKKAIHYLEKLVEQESQDELLQPGGT